MCSLQTCRAYADQRPSSSTRPGRGAYAQDCIADPSLMTLSMHCVFLYRFNQRRTGSSATQWACSPYPPAPHVLSHIPRFVPIFTDESGRSGSQRKRPGRSHRNLLVGAAGLPQSHQAGPVTHATSGDRVWWPCIFMRRLPKDVMEPGATRRCHSGRRKQVVGLVYIYDSRFHPTPVVAYKPQECSSPCYFSFAGLQHILRHGKLYRGQDV